MINDSKLKYALSNLGWIDKGNLWIFSSETKEVQTFKLSDADYLTLQKGENDYFAICHHYNNSSRFEVSLHHFADPKNIVCKICFDNYEFSAIGDVKLLHNIPRYYLASLKSDNKFHLFLIRDGQFVLDDEKTRWYYEGAFDFGYQGLIGVTECKDELIFCVQRDGSLYRYSLISNEIIDRVLLANRYGNPRITFSDEFKELWVDDYDSLLKIDPQTWRVEYLKQLQPSDNGSGQFIGSYSLIDDLIVVARPFSSDILILDKKLNQINKYMIGNQPLEAVLLDGLIVARDSKTGQLLMKKTLSNSKPTLRKGILEQFLIQFKKMRK